MIFWRFIVLGALVIELGNLRSQLLHSLYFLRIKSLPVRAKRRA